MTVIFSQSSSKYEYRTNAKKVYQTICRKKNNINGRKKSIFKRVNNNITKNIMIFFYLHTVRCGWSERAWRALAANNNNKSARGKREKEKGKMRRRYSDMEKVQNVQKGANTHTHTNTLIEFHFDASWFE